MYRGIAVVGQKVVRFPDVHSPMNRKQDDSVPRLPCVQFAATAYLEHTLRFLPVEMQTERNRDQFIPCGFFLTVKNLIDIGFLKAGIPHDIRAIESPLAGAEALLLRQLNNPKVSRDYRLSK